MLLSPHPEYYTQVKLSWWLAGIIVALSIVAQGVIGFGGAIGYELYSGNSVGFEDLSKLSMTALMQASFIGMLFGAVLVYWLAGIRSADDRQFVLKLYKPQPAVKRILLTIGVCIAVGIAAATIQHLIIPGQATGDLAEMDAMFGPLMSGYSWPLAVLGVIVFAPLAEELAFRGVLLTTLAKTRLGFHGANLLCALCWAGLHANYKISTLVVLVVLGLLFGYFVRANNSIWPTIAAHGTWNAMSILYMLTRLTA